MIWMPVTIQTISQIEALQNNNLPSTRLELMKALTIVLRMKCYFPFLKTHVKRFRDKYASSISSRHSNKISWNKVDEIAWRHFLEQSATQIGTTLPLLWWLQGNKVKAT
jgi:hypothetical protein